MPDKNLKLADGLGAGIACALYQPEIPMNVGSIARTCACTGVPLHLVGVLGFRLDDKMAKRGGLDYWEHADVTVHVTWEDFIEFAGDRRLVLFSTKGTKLYDSVEYRDGDILVFGCERTGLPGNLLQEYEGNVVVIPMVKDRRSLNISNAASVGIYNALRSINQSNRNI